MADDVCYYDIKQNDKYGRYLTASKDLVGGELIFKDTPFAVGPKPGKCQYLFFVCLSLIVKL